MAELRMSRRIFRATLMDKIKNEEVRGKNDSDKGSGAEYCN